MWRHNPRQGALAVECKPLIIKQFSIFRVGKTITLKMAN